MSKKLLIVMILVFLAVGVLGLVVSNNHTQTMSPNVKVVYGMSPYQDTILPIVGKQHGWYKREGLDVETKILDWGSIIPAVASKNVDVAIFDIQSFQGNAENVNQKGGDLVFYYASYIFIGNAITVRNDGSFKPFSEIAKQYPNNRERAVKETVQQLKGKTIVTTQGTAAEQVVLAAVEKGGLQKDDVKIINASPSDSLTAFLGGEGDGFSAGVTERTEAARHGGTTLISSADLIPPNIDGLITTKTFAKAHPEVLQKLIKVWFQTIQYMDQDLDHRSPFVTNYLAHVGSTKYTTDEYKYVWHNLHVFYANPKEVSESILNSNSPYYWKKAWDTNNSFLLREKKIKKPIPYDLFWGEHVQKELSN